MSCWDARYSHLLAALFKELWCSSQGHGCLRSSLFLSLFLSWHTLSVSLTLSHLLHGCRTQDNRCKCVAASLFSSLFIPFPSLPFSPLSSLGLQLRGRAHSLSHEAELLSFFFKCRVVWERGSERKKKGGRKGRKESTDQTDVPLQDTSVLQPARMLLREKANSFTVRYQPYSKTVAEAVETSHMFQLCKKWKGTKTFRRNDGLMK